MKERIEKILQDKRMTQAEFADLIGVSRSSITHLMTGRNKSSDTVVARTLLVFPDINPTWLSYGEGDMYLEHSSAPMQRLLFEDDDLEDNNPPTRFDQFDFENQKQTINPTIENNMLESDIQRLFANEDAVRKSPEVISMGNENKFPIASGGKKIKKVVFFYTDRTFEEYYPQEDE